MVPLKDFLDDPDDARVLEKAMRAESGRQIMVQFPDRNTYLNKGSDFKNELRSFLTTKFPAREIVEPFAGRASIPGSAKGIIEEVRSSQKSATNGPVILFADVTNPQIAGCFNFVCDPVSQADIQTFYFMPGPETPGMMKDLYSRRDFQINLKP